MRSRSTYLAIALAVLPCACVIDGVPLPDLHDGRNTSEDDSPSPADTANFGDTTVYATRSNGVTVVFGIPGAAPVNATIIARSGSTREARTTVSADGSFNLALIGQLDSTVVVQIVQSSVVTAQRTLTTPLSAELEVPNGSGTGNPPLVESDATIVDGDTAQFSLPAGSFASEAHIAIANLDLGTTTEGIAETDGSLIILVKAHSGDTLYVVAIDGGAASAPYVLTAP